MAFIEKKSKNSKNSKIQKFKTSKNSFDFVQTVKNDFSNLSQVGGADMYRRVTGRWFED